MLRQFLRPYGRRLAALVALQLCSVTATLYLPNLYARIVDEGVVRQDVTAILRTGSIMLGVSLVQVASAIAAVYFGAQIAIAIGRDLRGAVFHRVGAFSAHEVGKFGAPSLLTRCTNDVQQVQMLVLMGATMLISTPIMAVGGVVMALREDLALSRLLLVSVPVLIAVLGAIIGLMMPQYRVMQPKIDTVNRVLREQITGVRVVRAFVREPAEVERFAAANGDLTATAIKVGKLQALMWPAVMVVFNASNIGVVWYGGDRVAHGMAAGSLVAFLSYLMQILVAVMLVTFISVMIPRAAVCAERITEVLDTASSVVPPVRPVEPSGPAGLVEMHGVEYRYPGAEVAVLKDVTFTARPGQTTAIIGGTGAGKTTLLELIPRLIDPTAGTVAIEGTSAREIASERLWSKIGLVPQRAYLFSGTVASNLRYGNPDATDAELWAALEIAQARDFVEAMPQKLDTPIAQGGTTVSGGQRQRLSIARALLRKPSIFLFDDAFSALDLATEARLRAALVPHTQDATVIVVAQRVASIVDADQILVLEAGAIVGRGRHADLLRTCPTYVEIVTSQREDRAEAAA
ncbi:MAG TPA: ABC transporter ATP-binding protein [Kofleriaceae bacterium]|nr:ABC transporter ATP-binding protein [Kofleriaceae bacterium]